MNNEIERAEEKPAYSDRTFPLPGDPDFEYSAACCRDALLRKKGDPLAELDAITELVNDAIAKAEGRKP